jgi:molybdopterin molybdotransferase
MIGFDEAVRLVASAAKPLGSERVALDTAAGRVLASAVVARIDSPRCDVSSMDGYAVREPDLATLPARLKVVGESFAGGGFDGTLEAGECIRIFTGAPLPAGAGRVVIQEIVRREGDAAIFDAAPGEEPYIRLAGGDFRSGEVLLKAGRLLDARAIVAAAAADVAQLQVAKRPRVHILGTGDELVEPGSAATAPGTVPDSLSFGIAALVGAWGGRAIGRQRLGDNLAELERAAAHAVREGDLVVVTGGASVGDRDFAKAMFEPLGLELLFSKVAIKPGKPAWFGRVAGTPIIGLPGNPTSALVTARLLLAPLLAAMSGRNVPEALNWRSAPLVSALPGCGARETFHRARWRGGSVEILSNQDSSAQKMLAEADLLVRQRANTGALLAGEAVELLDF